MTEREDEALTLARLKIDLLARIGAALLSVQVTEKALKLVTTWVLQKSSPITAEQIIAQSESEQRRTLGYFLSELRKRADIEVHFDATLAEFLRRRNLLAHNLSDVPGWDIETCHGIYKGRCFINEFLELNGVVLKVFAGLIRGWQRQTGWTDPEPLDHEFFAEVDTKYMPLIDRIFFAKDGGR